MIILLPVVIFVSSASIICVLYCKSKNLQRQETQVNNVTRSRRLGGRQSTNIPSIYIIPTTNQVMQMYLNQTMNNAGQSRTNNEQCKPPPDYGQVAVEIPPSYEEAIVRASG